MGLFLAGREYTAANARAKAFAAVHVGGVEHGLGAAGPRYTGRATRVGRSVQLGVGERSPAGMTWDGTTLFMVGTTTDALHTVDRITGVATRVGSAVAFGVGETTPRGLTWDGTNLYMIGGGVAALHTVDRTTGVATRVGSATQFGVGESFATALAWDGERTVSYTHLTLPTTPYV